MRVKVPSQRRTKWLILAAAVAASALTWWQVQSAPTPEAPTRRGPPSGASDDLVEIEIQVGR